MGLVMTGYPVCVFKAIKVDCLFFARSPVMHARQRISSKKNLCSSSGYIDRMFLVDTRLTV